MVAIALLGLAVGLVVRYRRRTPFAAALGAWTVLAYPVALLSVSSISGNLFVFLLWWVAAVPAPAMIGAGVAVAHALRSRFGDAADGSRLCGFAVAMCTVPALVLTVAIIRAPNDPRDQWPVGPAAAERLLDDRATSTRDGVRVTPVQDTWQENAAFAAALARNGVDVTVSDDWLFMFGDLLRRTGDERAVASVLRSGDDPETVLGPDARDLGPVGTDGERLWVSP